VTVHVALAGGIGAARFLRGLVRAVPSREVTAVVNVGDDIDRHGLHVSPDLDSIIYWLGGAIDPDRQWGRADESFTVAAELERFGEGRWFSLGDRDLATHIYRTKRLREGAPLSQVTAEITRAFGLDLRLLPATDDPVETRVHTTDGRDLHFQEYWVGERAAPEVADVRLAGADRAAPAAGVIEAVASAGTLLLCPSNPVVSIGTILAVPGIRDALVAAPGPVVGISPIVGGRVVRGMADKLLPSVGADVSALGVARLYHDLLDGWVIDARDAHLATRIEDELGIRVAVTDTMMDDADVATALARTALELAHDARRAA
jgi:LPPG:FO 2-phospho-L-lactate transferase